MKLWNVIVSSAYGLELNIPYDIWAETEEKAEKEALRFAAESLFVTKSTERSKKLNEWISDE